MSEMNVLPFPLNRRNFLRTAGGAAAAAGLSVAAAQQSSSAAPNKVEPPPGEHAATDPKTKTPGPFRNDDQRVGFAVVGLGALSLEAILPAMAKTKYCKPVAFVTGHDGNLDKGMKLARQYNVRPEAVLHYSEYEKLAQMPEVKVIYIVLPNNMHEEYVLRGAKLGKDILCEKPMATTVAACERMIAACDKAGVKLMVAYRQQYEPNNRALAKMIREGKLGTLRSFIASNTQNQGREDQWRLKKAMAGGGCLPDVGIYCLNAARFLSNEEPYEVSGTTWQPKDDPRFTEVEATCSFTLRFPSGLIASCNTGYAGHSSQFYRVEGVEAWGALEPAFGYHGNKLMMSKLVDGTETQMQPRIQEQDQFALEMDHMATCVLKNLPPHTPGEEGLQDQKLLEAIYESARTGKAVKVAVPSKPTRGPEPVAEG
ncbi:Gfo/Idh/MocA family protein [Granulicella cerasi]|uniref:Gfo/Idh/MocA family protein n=1 Tax=Granulicella cerasi TaxID=741063 RepID=A0ABW1Z9T7_9BACT|nr:Gfo/Idh/MocA family oxidoreductase [Granulicella cerasi]